MARWLLENAQPDLKWTNFEGKSTLAIAPERKDQAMVALLEKHGAA